MSNNFTDKCATEELSVTCPKLELRSGNDDDDDGDDDDDVDDDEDLWAV